LFLVNNRSQKYKKASAYIIKADITHPHHGCVPALKYAISLKHAKPVAHQNGRSTTLNTVRAIITRTKFIINMYAIYP
jgi:hypothetical protein